MFARGADFTPADRLALLNLQTNIRALSAGVVSMRLLQMLAATPSPHPPVGSSVGPD